MTIWILALLLLAAGAGMGLRQGAIRVAVSFVGIIISALLAWPLSGLVRPLLPHLGVKNHLVVWLLPPFIVFCVLLFAFKFVGHLAHHKTEVYYKYKAADVQLILWRRLMKRLGLGFGLLNGLVYLVLISTVIYVFSYWTVQVAPSDNEKFMVRLLNRMGRDLDSTGLATAARAINPMPADYFKAADLAGLLYQNPQLKARLSDYPPFLSLAESDDYKKLGQAADFQNAWKSGSPLGQLLDNPAATAIWRDQDKAGALLALTLSNYDDLTNYLQTGRSAKYDPLKILGRWRFDLNASLLALEKSQTDLTSSQMQAVRSIWPDAYAQTAFVAGADGDAFLKSLPNFARQSQSGAIATATWQGKWIGSGDNYTLSLDSNGVSKSGTATVAGFELTLKTGAETLVFDREN